MIVVLAYKTFGFETLQNLHHGFQLVKYSIELIRLSYYTTLSEFKPINKLISKMGYYL